MPSLFNKEPKKIAFAIRILEEFPFSYWRTIKEQNKVKKTIEMGKGKVRGVRRKGNEIEDEVWDEMDLKASQLKMDLGLTDDQKLGDVLFGIGEGTSEIFKTRYKEWARYLDSLLSKDPNKVNEARLNLVKYIGNEIWSLGDEEKTIFDATGRPSVEAVERFKKINE